MILSPDLYRRWLAILRPRQTLADGPRPPPERWLQQIWRHQRIVRESLRLTDGRAVRVLHPGFWNRESGPDFRGGIVQFDTEKPIRGDIEVDVNEGGWETHRHDRNPAFRQVCLHVVWESDGAVGVPPTLPLHSYLDAPLSDLVPWLDSNAGSEFPDLTAGKCCSPLEQLPGPILSELWQQAARIRFEQKAACFEGRARQCGWEQALWEGLFAALGYKHNSWPFRRLAEVLLPTLAATPKQPLNETADRGNRSEEILVWQARLLGIAGLLPHNLPCGPSGKWVRTLWDCWWREHDKFVQEVLPAIAWRWSGVRPLNYPHRRLALAAHWIASGTLATRLEKSLLSATPGRSAARRFLEQLRPPDDPFWSRHWTCLSPCFRQPQPLLGQPRATDLAVNVVLPWLWARSQHGAEPGIQNHIVALHTEWPASEDNAVLKLARERLLGSHSKTRPRTAAEQQGLLQIVRDFCDRSNAVCAECRFPELVSKELREITPSTFQA
ncbi:MAG: DUF2851 family protein [Pedosphaera sp.]|nr:DUF2851 family protein [Pedosphaera sp.]